MTNRRDFFRQTSLMVAGSVVSGSILSSSVVSNSNDTASNPPSPPNHTNSGQKSMKLVVGSDHAGFALKAKLLGEIKKMGYEITDVGCFDETPVDFPDIARTLCSIILKGEAWRGIMFCGTGVGAAIACNKIPGIRASVCHDIYTAHQCVEHDDVQVIALGAQIVGHTVALEYIERYLGATFSTSEEFRRRVEKLEQMDIERK
jgi:ribose 5-phosphate isomerase B